MPTEVRARQKQAHVRPGTDKNSTPLLGRDQSFRLQQRECTTHRRATRAEPLGKLILGRQLRARLETSIDNGTAELVEHILIREATWQSKFSLSTSPPLSTSST